MADPYGKLAAAASAVGRSKSPAVSYLRDKKPAQMPVRL
jgi:hypothetical protein